MYGGANIRPRNQTSQSKDLTGETIRLEDIAVRQSSQGGSIPYQYGGYGEGNPVPGREGL